MEILSLCAIRPRSITSCMIEGPCVTHWTEHRLWLSLLFAFIHFLFCFYSFLFCLSTTSCKDGAVFWRYTLMACKIPDVNFWAGGCWDVCGMDVGGKNWIPPVLKTFPLMLFLQKRPFSKAIELVMRIISTPQWLALVPGIWAKWGWFGCFCKMKTAGFARKSSLHLETALNKPIFRTIPKLLVKPEPR